MKQVIRKTIAKANNIQTEPLLYTLLVDGNNLLKISLVDKRMNEKGEEYGAVFQFLYQLQKLLQKKDFNFCVVCWDGYNSGVLRYDYYPEYKANRDKHYEIASQMTDYDKKIADYCKKVIDYHKNHKATVKRLETDDESFERQKSIIQQILDELFIRQYICDNVEGDDLIAYYCQHKKDNERIVIVSGDRDITQLINDEVCVYIPSLKKFISPKNSIQELGYTHENVVLKKILCGDSSDNIKGVKRLGETTLFKLFPEIKSQKTTLNEILEHTKRLLEERKANKKKPLKSLENVLNKVTDGSQGERLYEINKKIIDLSEPLLTKEAIQELENTMYAPIDPSERDIKNVYIIIQENGMNDLLDENKFGSLFGAFERIIANEKKYFSSQN